MRLSASCGRRGRWRMTTFHWVPEVIWRSRRAKAGQPANMWDNTRGVPDEQTWSYPRASFSGRLAP